jgi:hypothetical protein
VFISPFHWTNLHFLEWHIEPQPPFNTAKELDTANAPTDVHMMCTEYCWGLDHTTFLLTKGIYRETGKWSPSLNVVRKNGFVFLTLQAEPLESATCKRIGLAAQH